MALALSGLAPIVDERVLVGTNTADDAGVIRITPDLALVQTVDVFAPIVDDAYTFGRIAAINSLSDIYAMGGMPLSALNVVGFPSDLPNEVLADMLRGGQDEIIKAGAVLLGGHTYQSTELRYGLSITGTIHPDDIITNQGAQAGDKLIFTKSLGTGTIVHAMASRGAVVTDLYEAAVESMLISNRDAAHVMKGKANACTDITGFGFIGHCWEMASACGLGMDIFIDCLPILPRVLELIRGGITNVGTKQNRNSFEDYAIFDDEIPPDYEILLYNAETSGGLLISVDGNKSNALMLALENIGVKAVIVGEVTTDHPGKVRITKNIK